MGSRAEDLEVNQRGYSFREAPALMAPSPFPADRDGDIEGCQDPSWRPFIHLAIPLPWHPETREQSQI